MHMAMDYEAVAQPMEFDVEANQDVNMQYDIEHCLALC